MSDCDDMNVDDYDPNELVRLKSNPFIAKCQ